MEYFFIHKKYCTKLVLYLYYFFYTFGYIELMKQRVANGEHVSISNNYSTVLVSFFRDFFRFFCIHSGILEQKGANRVNQCLENTSKLQPAFHYAYNVYKDWRQFDQIVYP